MINYQEGFLPVIGSVLYCPDFMVSIVSQLRVVKINLEYSKAVDVFSVTDFASGVSPTKYGPYVCDFPDQEDLSTTGTRFDGLGRLATTADHNKLPYSRRKSKA